VSDRPEAPRGPRPKRITVAVWLLWVSFGLGLPAAYLSMLREPEPGFSPVLVAIVSIFIAFSAVLNVLVYRGRNWARIAVLLLVAVGIPYVLLGPDEATRPDFLEQALDFVSNALDLVAVYLLFTPPGSLWFRRSAD